MGVSPVHRLEEEVGEENQAQPLEDAFLFSGKRDLNSSVTPLIAHVLTTQDHVESSGRQPFLQPMWSTSGRFPGHPLRWPIPRSGNSPRIMFFKIAVPVVGRVGGLPLPRKFQRSHIKVHYSDGVKSNSLIYVHYWCDPRPQPQVF